MFLFTGLPTFPNEGLRGAFKIAVLKDQKDYLASPCDNVVQEAENVGNMLLTSS